MPTERAFEANGVRFRALEWAGREPPALFVHATSLCADGWEPVVASLQAKIATPPRIRAPLLLVLGEHTAVAPARFVADLA